MKLDEARRLIEKGKKVRRSGWSNKDFFLPQSSDNESPYLDFEDIDANDWVIYKKKVYCETCGRES